MEIRGATTEDVSAIVSLLKLSLGETLMPKSVAFWTWKHVNNPFGVSPVVVAVDGKRIIGVRAFMRWLWKSATEHVEAVRAVDTATHPDHQGKGIFSKLTLSLLDECRQSGIQMVFNTPNEKSKPGYLKMGWHEVGKLPIAGKVINPLRIAVNLLSNNKRTGLEDEQSDQNRLSFFLRHKGLGQLIRKDEDRMGQHFNTAQSVQFLQWRYGDVPVVKYYADGLEGSELEALLFYRIKTTRIGRELRIADAFCSASVSARDLRELIGRQVKLHKPDLVTWSGLGRKFPGVAATFSGARVGPVVTIRRLGEVPIDSFFDFQQWTPSLGDLELF